MNALGSIGGQLAQMDPKAALAFAENLECEDEKQRTLMSMGWQMARYGVERASQLIAESEDPMVQRQLARQLVSEWLSYNRDAALQ